MSTNQSQRSGRRKSLAVLLLALQSVGAPILLASPAQAAAPTSQQRQVTINDITRDAVKDAGATAILTHANFNAVLTATKGALGTRAWEQEVPLSVVDSTSSDAFGEFSVTVNPELGTVGVATGGGTTDTTCAMAHVAPDATISTWDTTTVDGTCSSFMAAAAPGNGHGNAPATAGKKDRTAPVTVAGLTGTAGDGQASLSWTANPEADVIGYRIFQDGVAVGGVTAPETTMTVTGLTNYTPYSFTLAAIDGAGNISPVSAPATVTPVDLTPPPVPSGLVSDAEDGQVALDWTAVVAGDLAGYHVYRDGALVASVTSPSALITQLANFTTYSLTVASYDTRGNVSAQSVPVNATPVDLTPPGVPTNISATAGDSKVTLNWGQVVDSDLASYGIWVDGILVTSIHPADTHTVVNLTNYVQYGFSISTTDIHGNRSQQSAPVTATPIDLTPPAVVTNMIATPGDGQLAVSWSPSTSADVATYRVLVDGVLVAEVAAPLTEAALSGLVNDRNYTITVEAVDGVGNVSAPSTAVVATPHDNVAPEAAMDLTAVAGERSATLGWTPSIATDVVSYRLLQDGVVVQTLPATATSTTVTGLTNYVTYGFTIVAVDGAGNESLPSNEAVATPLDLTPAAVPTNLVGDPADAAAALSWSAVTTADLAGYQVLQDGVVVKYLTVAEAGTPPTFTVAGLTNDTTYSFTITSVDVNGNVSAQSNSVSVTPPPGVDLDTSVWDATSVPPMTNGRYEHSSVTDSSGRIYAIGGRSTDNQAILSSVERYDPATNSWSAVAPLPAPRQEHSSAVDSSGRIYVIGGSTTNTVLRYDPSTNVWESVAPMTHVRSNHSSAVDSQGRIYAIAGRTFGGSNVASAERYDPATNKWEPIASLSNERVHHSSAADKDGRIYVIAGKDDYHLLGLVERYDPATNRWTPVAGVGSGSHTASVTSHSGMIYTIGGQYNGETFYRSVHRYDPATNVWSGVAWLNGPRTSPSAAVDASGRLYAIGGYDSTWYRYAGGYQTAARGKSVERLG